MVALLVSGESYIPKYYPLASRVALLAGPDAAHTWRDRPFQLWALPKRNLLTTPQTHFAHHFSQLIAFRFFSRLSLLNIVAGFKFKGYHYESNLYYPKHYPSDDTAC